MGLLRDLISATTASTALSIPRLSAIAFAPEAKILTPVRMMAWASTVAVVVPSPASSCVFVATSRINRAPMSSKLSSSSISFAIVTPSLIMLGAPNCFSSITYRPRGPSVMPTALATLSTPLNRACLAFTSNNNCFAGI